MYGGLTCDAYSTYVTPTLLAGDRSLANVVAHEIAHSWTGMGKGRMLLVDSDSCYYDASYWSADLFLLP